jgi:hypothetical protein
VRRVRLSEPSRELAARILAKVGFEERLVGARMTPMSGVQEYPMYRFREAVNFLQVRSAREVVVAGPSASIPYVDPNILGKWVEEVFADTELAEAIREVVDGGGNCMDTIGRVSDLMRRRLEQCEAALQHDDPIA